MCSPLPLLPGVVATSFYQASLKFPTPSGSIPTAEEHVAHIGDGKAERAEGRLRRHPSPQGRARLADSCLRRRANEYDNNDSDDNAVMNMYRMMMIMIIMLILRASL